MSSTPAPTSWDAYARAVGIELQRRRIATGLTQEQLAHKAGLTRTHYQQLERGFWKQNKPANPSLKVLIRIAQVFEMNPGDLLPNSEAVEWPE